MPIPIPTTVSTFQTDFVGAYCATLDPAFGANPANIPSGDPVLALGFATAAVGVQLQAGYIALYIFARASTATGADLDSWFADFGYTRFQGSPATTTVTIPTSSGAAAVSNIPIPAGTIVSTQPIALAPSTVPQAYSFATVGSATLLAGQTSITVSVQATANGSNYNNIPTNTPLQLGTGIAGLGNPAFVSAPQFGQQAATDAQARVDFIDYITSLSDGTIAAVVAAVQDATGLVNGVNMAELDYATSNGVIQRGMAATVFISAGNSGQYTGSPYNAIAQAAQAAMQNVVALGITPIVYYATAYTVGSLAFTFTYSQTALTNAQLSLSGLEALMLGVLQTLFPATGGQLGNKVYFSQIARQFLELTYTNGSGIAISKLVTDVNIPAASITTGGGTFTGDLVQPGTPSTADALGYLVMATNVVPNWTAIAGT